MAKRVFLTVLDSCGIGAAPDAEKFGDEANCNTLKTIHGSPFFKADNFIKMGLGNIDGIDYLPKSESPAAAVARLEELSAGKDTTVGHWEICGVVSNKKLPTYPSGFPKSVIDEFISKTGRGVLCNKAYSGTQVIADYGEEHIKTGKLIVYTSADSVFQIAAHIDTVPVEQLYEYCRIARGILCGDNAVGRVIARPFKGVPGNFVRTPDRHDFSLEPTGETLLDAAAKQGFDVYSIGKIYDIFAHRGITRHVFTQNNGDGILKLQEALDMRFAGICFTNLVDFDMLYGHRRDTDGYAKAFAQFDGALPLITSKMHEDDVLIITADHGCDPGYLKHTDHTREYVPLIVYGKNINPVNLGTRVGFCDIAAFIADYLGIDYKCAGKSFFNEIIK